MANLYSEQSKALELIRENLIRNFGAGDEARAREVSSFPEAPASVMEPSQPILQPEFSSKKEEEKKSFDLTAALRRVAEGFKRRGTADKYSATMVDGKAVIGDIRAGVPRENEIALESPTPSTANNLVSSINTSQKIIDTMSTTAESIKNLRNMIDSGKDENGMPISTFQKQELVYKVEGLHGAFLGFAQQNAIVKAEGLHEVNSLRERVAQAHAEDKMDPLYERFGRVPSPFTQQLEAELSKAQLASRNEAEQIYKSDPVVNSIANENHSYIKNTMGRLNESLQREEEFNKEFAALGTGFSVQMQELAEANSYANNMGILTVEEKVNQSKNLAKDQKARLAAETMSPADLREQAIAGNPYAYNKLAFLEAKSRVPENTRPATDPFKEVYKAVQGDLTFIKDMTTSPEKFTLQYEAREKAKGVDSVDDIKATAKGINSLPAKEAEARRASYAIEAVKEERKKIFLSNVDAWRDVDFTKSETPLEKLYSVAKQKVPAGSPVDFVALTSSLSGLNSADRAAAMIDLNKATKIAAYSASGDYLADFASGLDLQKDISNAVAFNISKILSDITGMSMLTGSTVPVPGR